MKTSMSALKSLHDQLLAEKPEDAKHDFCPLCAMTEEDLEKETSLTTTYSEEDLKTEVAKATAALETRIKELEASQQVSETESKVAEVKAEAAAELAELQTKLDGIQSQLDEKVLEATAEKNRADGMLSWLEGEAKAAEEREAAAARMDERLAQVKAAAEFPEDYLDANKERFAAMSDEDFALAVEGWKTISGKPSSTDGKIPAETAMHTGREQVKPAGESAMKDLMGLRRQHGRLDFSTL
jgi:DNA repair exonuclease SbcCD ATPase subunit